MTQILVKFPTVPPPPEKNRKSFLLLIQENLECKYHCPAVTVSRYYIRSRLSDLEYNYIYTTRIAILIRPLNLALLNINAHT